jgi:predicted O-linked N-acetylglucosamine transferase (SPINDLY family)
LGIKTENIILEEGSPRAQYLLAYSKVDFMLDTFPYPGGTTTCEALWMGVPTLTLAGNTLLERQGAAMLSCSGLDDWIANNEDEYLQKAISFAHSIEYLSQLRSTIRDKMAISPLVDADLFAKNLNSAFNSMWQEKMQQTIVNA